MACIFGGRAGTCTFRPRCFDLVAGVRQGDLIATLHVTFLPEGSSGNHAQSSHVKLRVYYNGTCALNQRY